jgi:hypothetical protein
LLAPSFDKATAWGFRVSGGSGGALPVTLSMIALAICVKSRFFPVLLARVGMPPNLTVGSGGVNAIYFFLWLKLHHYPLLLSGTFPGIKFYVCI